MRPGGRAGSTGAVFLLLSAALMVVIFQGEAQSSNKPLMSDPVPSDAIYDDRIYIEGNSGFTQDNGVSSGSGTPSDPYIIEDMYISAYNGKGIAIRNTTKYYIIRNCTVINGGANQNQQNNGIDLFNSTNGRIERCHLMNNLVNIYGTGLKNMVIIQNEINRSSDDCLYLELSTNLNVSNNRVWFTGMNGIHLTQVYIADLFGNEVNHTTFGIFLEYSSVLRIIDNYIHNNQRGIFLYNSATTIIRENDLYYNNKGSPTIGIDLEWSSNDVNISHNNIICSHYGIRAKNESIEHRSISIFDNQISECMNAGIELSGSKFFILNNRIINNLSSTGISLSSSIEVQVINNKISYGLTGIKGKICSADDIIGNDIDHVMVGIEILDAERGMIKENRIDSTEWGIRLSSSYFQSYYMNEIVDNTIGSATDCGIWIDGDCWYNHISGNIILDCYTGIYFENILGEDNIVTSNYLSGFFHAGMVLYGDRSGTFRSNIFNGSNIAMHISNCKGTEIIDNCFLNNIISYDSMSKELVWNIERTKKMNIMGGPYLSGNYWSDYFGIDIDHDGIGDTNLPHGPGDNGPLIKDPVLDRDTTRPWVEELTSSLPRTGTTFIKDYRACDDRLLLDPDPNVRVEYLSLVKGKWSDVPELELVPGPNNEFRMFVEVPTDSLRLRVSIEFKDFSGNTGYTSFEYEVEDSIPPEIIELIHYPEAGTGKLFRVEYYLLDNIGFSTVLLGYCQTDQETFYRTSGPDETFNWSYTAEGGMGHYARFEIFVPDDYTSLTFWPIISDQDGNWAPKDRTVVPVKDGIAPEVELISGQTVYSGRMNTLSFRAWDNRGISLAILSIRTGDQPGTSVGEPQRDGDIFTFTFKTDKEPLDLIFEIEVWDTSGNSVQLSGTMDLLDGVPPTIYDLTTLDPMTGHQHALNISVWDDRGLERSFVEWWFDSSPATNVTLGSDPVQIRKVPLDASFLHYRVGGQDLQGNWAFRTFTSTVKDMTAPQVFIEEGTPVTDHEHDFLVRTIDNREVSDVQVHCISEPGYIPLDAIHLNGDLYKVFIPIDSMLLSITVKAYDTMGNEGISERSISVKDATPPVIKEASMVQNGKQGIFRSFLKASDNRGIKEAKVVITDGNRDLQWIILSDNSKGEYENTTKVKYDRFSYYFQVTDLEGNSAFTDPEVHNSSTKDGPNNLLLFSVILFFILSIISAVGIMYAVKVKTVRDHNRQLVQPVPNVNVQDPTSVQRENTPSRLTQAFRTISTQGKVLMNAPGESIRAKQSKAIEEEAAKIERLESERFALMASEEKRIIGTYLNR